MAKSALDSKLLDPSRSAPDVAPATFEAAFDNAPAGMAIGDGEGLILRANPALAALLGFPPDDLIGKSINELMHAEDVPRSRAAFDHIRRGDVADYSLHTRCVHRNGHTVSVRAHVSTLQDTPRRYLLHVIDITGDKLAAERLRVTESRFHEMAEAIEQDFWIMSFEPLELLYTSPAAARIWGFDTMINRDQPARIIDYLHPDDIEPFVQVFDPAHPSPREREYRITRADGVPRWLRTRVFPILDTAGNVYRLTGVTEDITVRKEAELAVARHREFERFIMKLCTAFVNLPAEQVQATFERSLGELALLIDADRAAIFVIDERSEVLAIKYAWSREGIARQPTYSEFSFSPHNPLRMQIVAEGLLRIDDVDALPDELSDVRDKLRANGVGSFIDLPLVRRGKLVGLYGFGTIDRKVTWPKDVAARLAIAAEVFSSAIERARMEDEVRKHRDALAHALRVGTMGQLASGIAHELNQPLAAILNYASAYERRATSGVTDLDFVRTLVRKMGDQAIRAAEVIKTLRMLVRKGQGQRTWQDPHELVQTALRFMEPELGTPGVAVIVEQHTALPQVQVDPIQIEQVVMNLVRNAVDAVRATAGEVRREVTVATRLASPDLVEVRVTDSGTGIDAQQVRHLFDEFFTTKAHGLGLGLSISRSIVESHGGTMWMESTSPAGTTFCFTLPSSPPE